MDNKFAVVEKKFDYKGHECICVFTHLGFRNGYVSTKIKKEYDDFDITCHGGLTYSGELHKEYEPREDFYIGFDCGHYNDGQDYSQALKYGLITEKFFCQITNYRMCQDIYGTLPLSFIEEECRKIVDQLEKI